MRLLISCDSFTIEGVPRGIDLSDLRAFCGVSWDGRRRKLVVPLGDAAMLRSDLERRGVRLADAEVRAATVRAIEDDPLEAPVCVAQYGDERAIPELSRMFDAYTPGECAVTDFVVLLGLATAIEALGGEVTKPQRAKLAEFERLQRHAWPDDGAAARAKLAELLPSAAAALATPPTAPRPFRRPGRNAACHCGSGKKYKNCHLGLDAEESVADGATRH